MNNFDNIKQQIGDLQKSINEKIEQLHVLFETELAKFITEHTNMEGYTLKNMYISINNHEFNDGSPTHFSVNYDDLTLYLWDKDNNEVEVESYGNNVELEQLRKDFVTFFSNFDIGNLYEKKFGDMYEGLYIRLDAQNKLCIQ